eukprot:Filipodium_phascolosomae@DN1995_c0_g1_i1.p1
MVKCLVTTVTEWQFDSLKKEYGAEHVEFVYSGVPLKNKENVQAAVGYPILGSWALDVLNAENLKLLADGGLKVICQMCAGFENIDLKAAEELGIRVLRVPAYSPHSIAEYAMALLQTLNRKVNRAYNRVRNGNFYLGGLSGQCLHGKTMGVVGTGKIGSITVNIARGYGLNVLVCDVFENEEIKKNGNQIC